MKTSLALVVVAALMSVSAFAGENFVQRQRGNCQTVAAHAEEKAVGNCLWAQFTECRVVSNNLIEYNGYSCEYEAVVYGQAQDKNPARNRILKGTAAGDCGYVIGEARNEALARCPAGARCEIIQDVTVSDNGRDFCEQYALARVYY